MSINDLLYVRRTEHEALLQRAVEVLQQDERVVAAWLFGSRGRKTSDELSDTDLWVVVADEHIDTINAERQTYVTRPGHPLLVLEAPGNAPAQGAYLMALYAGQAGVHQVDWYWQRQSDASIPLHALVLFDRVGIPRDTRLEQLDPPGTPGQELNFRQCSLLIRLRCCVKLPMRWSKCTHRSSYWVGRSNLRPSQPFTTFLSLRMLCCEKESTSMMWVLGKPLAFRQAAVS